MPGPKAVPSGKHYILRPINLRPIDLPVDLRLVHRTNLDTPLWDRGASSAYEGVTVLGWDNLEREERDPEATARCLWDLLDLPRGVPDARFTREVAEFIRKWGILDYGREVRYGDSDPPDSFNSLLVDTGRTATYGEANNPGCEQLARWSQQAATLSGLLDALIATEAAELLIKQRALDLWSAGGLWVVD